MLQALLQRQEQEASETGATAGARQAPTNAGQVADRRESATGIDELGSDAVGQADRQRPGPSQRRHFRSALAFYVCVFLKIYSQLILDTGLY